MFTRITDFCLACSGEVDGFFGAGMGYVVRVNEENVGREELSAVEVLVAEKAERGKCC